MRYTNNGINHTNTKRKSKRAHKGQRLETINKIINLQKGLLQNPLNVEHIASTVKVKDAFINLIHGIISLQGNPDDAWIAKKRSVSAITSE